MRFPRIGRGRAQSPGQERTATEWLGMEGEKMCKTCTEAALGQLVEDIKAESDEYGKPMTWPEITRRVREIADASERMGREEKGLPVT